MITKLGMVETYLEVFQIKIPKNNALITWYLKVTRQTKTVLFLLPNLAAQ